MKVKIKAEDGREEHWDEEDNKDQYEMENGDKIEAYVSIINIKHCKQK